MRNVLRILLCILSISIAFTAQASTSENQSPSQALIASPEVILDSNLGIEIPAYRFSAFSPEKVLESLSTWSGYAYYSLLNWKKANRSQPLTVESYQRVFHFGQWINDNRDKTCLNTRAKVLIRDSVRNVVFEKTNSCSVQSGKWNDPYANKILLDARVEVQIDHMVPLKNAYVSGAYSWNYKQRCLYGNYLGASYHLISVDGTENMRKSSAGPDRYLPPNQAYRCTYLKNWLLIKSLWGLEMSLVEAQAIKDAIISENCSLSSFRISAAEIYRQRKFAALNAELCTKTTPLNNRN